MSDGSLTIRGLSSGDLVGPGEGSWLHAAGQSRGPVLLAERHGLPVATIALTSGAVAADPGIPPRDLQSLRLARYRLMRQSGNRWRIAALRWTAPPGEMSSEHPGLPAAA